MQVPVAERQFQGYKSLIFLKVDSKPAIKIIIFIYLPATQLQSKKYQHESFIHHCYAFRFLLCL